MIKVPFEKDCLIVEKGTTRVNMVKCENCVEVRVVKHFLVVETSHQSQISWKVDYQELSMLYLCWTNYISIYLKAVLVDKFFDSSWCQQVVVLCGGP